ncbi:MAG: GTP-binding protein [Candidatus Heimdallarchaeota archaeon]|nr:GTP-binding protein [Candidatus Heimdallarchaeota archaeon]
MRNNIWNISLKSDETANIKVVIIGDNSVGKASVISRFFGKPINHPSGQRANLGMEFMVQEIEMGGKLYKFHIFVTEGGESGSLLRRRHYGGANAFFIIYDVSNLSSFENITSYLQEVIEGAGKAMTPLLYIVANKIELRSSVEPCVTKKEAESIFNSLNTENILDLSYIEVSCVTGENFDRFISSFHKSIVFGRDLKLV